MSKNSEDKLAAATELLKKVAQNPESVSNADKKQIKKLSLTIRALQNIAAEQDPTGTTVPYPRNPDDDRTVEEIIADNYVALAKFAIEKMNLKSAHKLKVQRVGGGFVFLRAYSRTC